MIIRSIITLLFSKKNCDFTIGWIMNIGKMYLFSKPTYMYIRLILGQGREPQGGRVAALSRRILAASRSGYFESRLLSAAEVMQRRFPAAPTSKSVLST